MIAVTALELKILVIEDNYGDYVLIEDYLSESFIRKQKILHAKNFAAVKSIVTSNPDIDVILLDLSLPDIEGEELIQEIHKFTHQIPIIILTGFSNKEFGIKTLSYGIC